MTPVRITSSLAVFVGFVLAALVNLPSVVGPARAADAGVAATALLDVAHFLCAGLLAAGVVRLWSLLPPPRSVVHVLSLFVLAVGLGFPLLEGDLHNFCARHAETAPPWLTRIALTVPISAGVPGALVAAHVLGRLPWGRWLGVALAAGVLAVNARILVRDYPGIHLYLTWSSATLAAGAFSGAALPARLAELGVLARFAGAGSMARRAVLGGVLLAAGAAGFFALGAARPSARVLSVLSAQSSSVFVPFTGSLRARLKVRRSKALVGDDPWLGPRPSAPASQASLPGFPDKAFVILITVDALRADLINSTKYSHRLPNFAKLRERCLTFTEARATGTATRPSIASVFMGTHTLQQYWVETEGALAIPVEDESVRFPELLSKAGVNTWNLASMNVLRSKAGVVGGFESEQRVRGSKKASYTSASRMVKSIGRALTRAKPPLFLYAHLGDPHEPYDMAGSEGSDFERYLAEVALVDKHLGRLIRQLKKKRKLRRTVLIISADHGEAFGEHNSSSHGTTVYDEVLRVPLLVCGTDVKPRTIGGLVSLIDLGPTILDLFGLETPAHFMGQSLEPYLLGESPMLTRPIVAEARSLLTYVGPDKLKVILDTKTSRAELYDLVQDPLELRNIADDEDRLERPLAYLDKFREVHKLRREGYVVPNIR